MNAPDQITPSHGIHDGISNEQYHAGPGTSNSDLSLIERSPFIYYSMKLDPNRPAGMNAETASQLHGTLAHCAILEPDEFGKRYVFTPADAPRRPTEVQRNAKKPSDETIAAIAWWDEFNAANAGKQVITVDQYSTAWRQAESVRRDPQIRELLSAGRAEQSAYWMDPVTGLLCKCRPDWIHPVGDSGVILCDVKTFDSAKPDDFARQAGRMGYHRQRAYYGDGYEIAADTTVHDFVFIVVEDKWPFACCPVMLGERSVEQGRREYRRHLNTLAGCLSRNEWPGYYDGVAQVDIPNYLIEN